MNGVIYARYSSDNQREESIDGQIRECKEFAEKNDIRIIDTYIDRALSAKTDNRPSFQQMIKDSSKGLFDVIIVWKLDRFARNRYDSAHYKNILKKNGVKVVSATEAISSGAEGILLESMLEGYAEYYSAELAEKINRGLTENALKCKYNGGSVAFGYMIDDEQHFQINPTLAPVVLNIFNDYISGKTQKEIRDELNNKGLKNANGREFTINNISKILTNRRYIGNYIYKDVVIENGIPAIIPNDVFYKVQEMIAVNKRAPSRHKAVDDYLLTTKLYCGKCMSFMVGESGNARGRRYSYYKCVNTKRNKTCDKKAVKKDWIEDIVIYQVIKFINDDSLIEMLVNKILFIQGKESPMLKSLKKQLAQTNTAIENMLNAIEQGIITKSTKKRLDELESTKENLETEIAKENISHPLLTKEFLYSWFDGFKNFDVNKLENRKMLIDTFVNSVVLYDDRIDFYFNFKDNAKSLALSELNTVSDLSSSSPPKRNDNFRKRIVVSFCSFHFYFFVLLFSLNCRFRIKDKREEIKEMAALLCKALIVKVIYGTIYFEVIPMESPLLNKSLDFATEIVLFYEKFNKAKRDTTVAKQLLRSATSVGANINEAVYGNSKADFISKLHIALKETGESIYWLTLLKRTNLIEYKYDELLLLAEEIKRMLVASLNTVKGNK